MKNDVPSEESYMDFLCHSGDFYHFSSVEEYLQGCLDETIHSNHKSYTCIYGNETELVSVGSRMALEITVSDKPVKNVHFDALPEAYSGYRKILLTKSVFQTDTDIAKVPYYIFLTGIETARGRDIDTDALLRGLSEWDIPVADRPSGMEERDD